jgi:hypothetical protein
MTANDRDQAVVMVRVELGYCPRCGTLRAHLVGASEKFCEACEKISAWIRTGCERPPRRRPRRSPSSGGGR